jgi:hypothetical protein
MIENLQADVELNRAKAQASAGWCFDLLCVSSACLTWHPAAIRFRICFCEEWANTVAPCSGGFCVVFSFHSASRFAVVAPVESQLNEERARFEQQAHEWEEKEAAHMAEINSTHFVLFSYSRLVYLGQDITTHCGEERPRRGDERNETTIPLLRSMHARIHSVSVFVLCRFSRSESNHPIFTTTTLLSSAPSALPILGFRVGRTLQCELTLECMCATCGTD